jgi:hypothetical protein
MEAEDVLIQASRGGDLKRVQALLSQGLDVNFRGTDGGTALVSTSWNGDLDIVRLLLSKGANVNLKSIDPGTGGGRTPLIAASREGHLKVVEALLAPGADVDETDGEGRDALMWASCGDYLRIARVSLFRGASPRAKDHRLLRELVSRVFGHRPSLFGAGQPAMRTVQRNRKDLCEWRSALPELRLTRPHPAVKLGSNGLPRQNAPKTPQGGSRGDVAHHTRARQGTKQPRQVGTERALAVVACRLDALRTVGCRREVAALVGAPKHK